tara:strand:+ start:508 stop:963 length:456 start_codon:yes stop_codon:yes gene_type:complete
MQRYVITAVVFARPDQGQEEYRQLDQELEASLAVVPVAALVVSVVALAFLLVARQAQELLDQLVRLESLCLVGSLLVALVCSYLVQLAHLHHCRVAAAESVTHAEEQLASLAFCQIALPKSQLFLALVAVVLAVVDCQMVACNIILFTYLF